MLTVAVDARSMSGQLAGIGRYVYEILKELSEDCSFRFLLYCAPSPPHTPADPSWSFRSTRLPRQVALKWRFGQWANDDRADVFWAPQTLSPRTRIPVVATVHDLNHLLVPQTMSWGTRLAHKKWFKSDLLSTAAVVANSSATADRLHSLLKVRASSVARPGVGAEFRQVDLRVRERVLARLGVSGEFLLAVGTLEPRKNFGNLLSAHNNLYREGRVPKLVLVGQSGWGNKLKLESNDGVKLLGYVDRLDLPALYSSAKAFLIPSIYEGFGMPAAEARACGCTVVATDIPELREATGEFGIFVSPTESGIAEGILSALSAKNIAPSITATWQEAADVYRRAFLSVAK